jgi:SPX domain protein involved in polyphosphate accumulation
MRYENKFVFDGSLYHGIYNQILLSPAFFKEIYYERRVNNIYLDSFDYANYYANINGEQNRIKQRIRWYGDTFEAKTPILEYYEMPDFKLDESFIYSNYLALLPHHIKEFNEKYFEMYNDISQQTPTLYNTYDRRYFLSGDGKYRLTIDRNMSFSKIGATFNNPYSFNSRDIVVELKYDEDDVLGACELIQHFDFRLSRNSKYVNGISGLYFNSIEFD